MSGFWLGYKIGFRKNKQVRNQCSGARERACQHDERQEESAKHRIVKKDELIGRFKLFLHRSIPVSISNPNIIQNFSKISRFKILHHNFKCATVEKQEIF